MCRHEPRTTLRCRRRHRGVLPVTLLLLSAAGAAASPLPAQDAVSVEAVDSVFADVDRTDRPGCAVSVTREGRLEIARGYGMANLEYGVPIRSSSVFHVASVSKQFTAFAVELLAAEGRVSWDDDIREYVPELADLGHTVTLDHLVHHTSGVRDQWELLIMGGWRWEADVVRQRDALGMITRQTALNFRPGTDWVYSNSGYTLLAAVVERVTGRTLAEFARERIFEPLGMHDTRFRDDHQAVVRGRAYAYAPDPEAEWKISIPDFAIVGATSLFTTVEDLARWERNFRTADVGGRGVVDGMLHRVRVAEEQHGYAHGLFVGDDRGLRTVGHGGADAGYRAHFVRYPEQAVAVAVLCNEPAAGPGDRARRVAALYLTDSFDPSAEPDADRAEGAGEEAAAEAAGLGTGDPSTADGRPLDRLAGWYASPANDHPVRISHDEESGLSLAIGSRSSRELVARSDSTFGLPGAPLTVIVPRDPAAWGEAILVDDGTGQPRRYLRAEPADTSRAALEAYEGRYWSDEVGTFYDVRVGDDGGLELRHRRHGTVHPNPMHRDAFSFRGGFLGLTFTRDEDGRVDGFTLSGSRSWKVPFRKTASEGPPDAT